MVYIDITRPDKSGVRYLDQAWASRGPDSIIGDEASHICTKCIHFKAHPRVELRSSICRVSLHELLSSRRVVPVKLLAQV